MNPFQSRFSIGKKEIGAGCRPFVIAEAGVNHNGDVGLAKKMVVAAKEAGADAIKFQTFRADALASPLAAPAHHSILRSLELTPAAHIDLFSYCQELEIPFLSTPFDEQSATFLHQLGVPAFKIASGELNLDPFLVHVARLGLPVILSTGMADLAEVGHAVSVLRHHLTQPIVLLHCTSSYPTPIADCNIRAMQTLAAEFDLPVGLSDHSEGLVAAGAAVALGACVIEKHFTLDRNLPGPDQALSLNPSELARFIEHTRKVEACLGNGIKAPQTSEREVILAARRSLVAARALGVGERLDGDAICLRRPGTGLAPSLLEDLQGRRMKKPIQPGELFSWDHFESM